MSARPRPRPRPRPVAKPPAAGSDNGEVLTATNQASSSTTAAAATNVAPQNNTIEDEDALFMRNRGRTAEQWKQLHQLAERNAHVSEPTVDSEDEASGQSSPARPTKKKKKRDKQNDVPRWQAIGVAELLSSDGEDDDLEIIECALGVDSDAHASPRKRKRQRSRSRSITPPPALSAHQLANARHLVRQALAVEARAPSPILVPDDSTDTIVLDPELAKIEEAVKKQATQQKFRGEGGGPEIVEIKVSWIPHPLNSAAQKHVWVFHIKRHDTFHDLFEEIADLASIMVDQLVITFDGKHVFPSGSPHSLHMWAEGELEARDKATHDYIRSHYRQCTQSPPSQAAEPVDEILSEMPSGEAESDDSEAESTSGDKFKLVLRSGVTKDITLTVRPTTTCGAIVKAFLKAAGLPDTYSDVRSAGRKKAPQLKIDGEKQAPGTEIGDADLEDGDMVEVAGI
ncbi:hypothetical protein ID866_4392 [Astraeus odoratus]|nr:hypothetical protein ID866_4392 [Astraeus odoratus]